MTAIPRVGETYIHAKTGEPYVIYCISESGDKESNQLFITYYAKEDILKARLFTRILEDFLARVPYAPQRFLRQE